MPEQAIPEKRRITPRESFPTDLSLLSDTDLQVLNSRVVRQLDYECVFHGCPEPETEFRQDEVAAELDARDARDAGVPGMAAADAQSRDGQS